MVTVFRAFSQQCLYVAAVVPLVTGCTRRLPPPATPENVVPTVAQASSPPAAGTGRLVVDVTNGPTPVTTVHPEPQQITNGNGRISYRFDDKQVPMCPASPCVTDLTPANVLIAFPVIGDPDSLETELVHVGPETNVYRRTLSVYTPRRSGRYVMGIIMASLGGTALFTGGALLPVGLAKDNTGLTEAGAISLGGGAALLTLGILAIYTGAATYRPGSTTHFTIDPTPAPP